MASLLVPSSSRKHQPLPTMSQPSSPVEEEDLSARAAWHDDDTEHREHLVSGGHKGKGKGKGKERAREPSSDIDEGDESPQNGALTPVMEEGSGYPPTTEEEDEERRVAENLRRWEQAERMRRRAARESASLSEGPSLVGDVVRRSILWHSRRQSRRTSSNLENGGHDKLSANEDDSLPLAEIVSPAGSAPSSPLPRVQVDRTKPKRTDSMKSDDTVRPRLSNENPFSDPPETHRKHSNDFESIVEEESESPIVRPQPDSSRDSIIRARNRAPPPRPLDLPPPRTPPPRVMTPGVIMTSPPKPVLSPTIDRRLGSEEASHEHEPQWWTDWLCGCREGGVDSQAGRTNPFE